MPAPAPAKTSATVHKRAPRAAQTLCEKSLDAVMRNLFLEMCVPKKIIFSQDRNLQFSKGYHSIMAKKNCPLLLFCFILLNEILPVIA